MTEGPILKKLFKFMLPIAIINVTYILYNAIDAAILGNMTGDDAVAAVGTTSSIIFLLTAFSNGLSNGVSVVVGRAVGAKDPDRARQATGTALVTGLLSSLIMLAIILPLARTTLIWLRCDPLVLDAASTYLRIILLSMPLQWLYNFMAAAIRSSGNSSTPMTIMLIAGGFKVLLNLLFIGGFHMGVVGAGLSTVLSQTISFLMVLVVVLRRKDAPYALRRANLRIRKEILFSVVRFGLPSGLSSVFFYTSNAVIQSAVNSLGKTAMTANSVATQFDSFVYTLGGAVAAAAVAFVSQNVGARKPERVKSVLGIASGLATVLSLSAGVVFVIFARPLCGLITDNPEIIELARQRMILLCLTYFTSSVMEILSNSLSAMGYYKNHLCIGFIIGLCVRSGWALYVWPTLGTLPALHLVVPASCLVAIAEYVFVFFRFALPRLRKIAAEEAPASAR